MQNKTRPLAVVTGASSGLGADFARLLAKDGYDLVLVARTQPALEELATELGSKHGAHSHVLSMDLSKAGAGAAVARACAEQGLEVDVLINNAGFGDNETFADADPERISGMTQLNVVTLTDLTREFLPGMIARRKGKIMLVASTASFQPGPHMAVYCATKAYVLSLGEALAFEVRGTGVSMTTLCPGPTATNFVKAAKLGGETMLFKAAVMTSADVARQGYNAMKLGLPVYVAGVTNLVGAAMGRYVPHFFTLPIASRILSKQ